MKKYFFLLCFTFLLSHSGFSQLSLRPQLGIQFSNFSLESIQGELTGSAGISYGIDLQIGTTFYVQPGVMITPLNFQIQDVGDIKITKLNVPIMAGYKLFEQEGSKAFGIRLFAGPNFAFNINDSISDAITSITLDDLNKFHLSGIGGIGFDISILFLDLGYRFGITETISPRNGSGANFNGFMANAGIRIGF